MGYRVLQEGSGLAVSERNSRAVARELLHVVDVADRRALRTSQAPRVGRREPAQGALGLDRVHHDLPLERHPLGLTTTTAITRRRNERRPALSLGRSRFQNGEKLVLHMKPLFQGPETRHGRQYNAAYNIVQVPANRACTNV